MAQKDIVNIVKQYITKLSSSGVKIYKAYLFGSYARNEATDLSDIDVLIVSDAYNGFNIEKKPLPGQLQTTLTCVLNLILWELIDFSQLVL